MSKGVDTHCHLQMEQFDADRQEALARALDALDWIAVVGDRVFAVVGVHPYHAAELDETGETLLREMAGNPGVVAIGETGLDYYNEFTPRALQRPCFEKQLQLAAELQLPVVIHSRAADDDAAAIIANAIPSLKACVMHCFGGGRAFAERCLAMGCWLSFAGNVTFPKANELREAAAATPVERLLVETDAPYLAPQCLRGKRCEPAYVLHTLAFLAELKGKTHEELAARTAENSRFVFSVVDSGREGDGRH